VEYDFGVLNVETELARILDLSDAGENPNCLRIRGWTFNVPITRESRRISDAFRWTLQFPEHLRGRLISDEPSITSDDATFQALGLVLSAGQAPEQQEPWGNVCFLVVQPGKEAGTFERVEFVGVDHSPDEVDKLFDSPTTWSLSDRRHLCGVDLEYAEIRLV
jgi:hypothetical protein